MLARLPIPHNVARIRGFEIEEFYLTQILDIKKTAISWFHYFSVWPNHGAERET